MAWAPVITTWLDRSSRIPGTHGTQIATRPWRLRVRTVQWRPTVCLTTRIQPGVTLTPMEAGMTYPMKAMCGRHMKPLGRGGILMDRVTGCRVPAMVMRGFPPNHGATCPTTVETGATTTALVGDGPRAAAITGGAGGTTAEGVAWRETDRE